MALRFVHTSDWQLGRPFAEFDPDLAGKLSAARLDAIEKIAQIARQQSAPHVIVAGDVWDNSAPSDRLLRQPLDLMKSASDIAWYLLPGNHDPSERFGLWDRLRAMSVPPNIYLLTDPAPVQIGQEAVILPAPWTSKAPGRDLTSHFESIDTAPDVMRIGVAHGGVTEFFDQSPQSSRIDDNRAANSGLDYLALGDWHGMQRINEKTWYSGTPEPDRFPKNDPGHVLVVEAERNGPLKVSPIGTAAYIWTRNEIQCQIGVDPFEDLTKILDDCGPRHRRLCRLELTGVLKLDARIKFLAFIEQERQSLAHLRLKADKLLSAVDPETLNSIDHEGTLRDTANTLALRMEDENLSEAERIIARRALDYLAAFASNTGAS